MLIEKIKDDELRSRILGYKKNFPRRLSHDNPTKNPQVAKMIAEMTEGDDMICLPKDSTLIEINRSLDNPGSMILPSAIVEHFIRNASHRVVMNFCICRDSMECRDYPIELGCIFLGDGVKDIHPELGREVDVDEALDYARRCREAGLVYSVGKNKLDAIWLSVGDDSKLLTICSCCPCCCLSRTVPYSAPEIREKLSRMPGVTVTVNKECIGCGACIDRCIFQAIEIRDNLAVINSECRGCTRCAEVCPENAIQVAIDDKAYAKNTIDRISKIVDYR